MLDVDTDPEAYPPITLFDEKLGRDAQRSATAADVDNRQALGSRTTNLRDMGNRMAKIAYIGVGNMGRAMIVRLLKAGHKISAYNRTPEKAKVVVDAGAKLAKTPAEAVEGADVVFSSVTERRRVARRCGPGRKASSPGSSSPNTLVAECSTLSHDWVMELAGLVKAKGLRYVDCPVAGRPDAAEAGELRVYIGGTKEDLEELRPYIEPFSKKIFHFGPVGAGTAYKLIYNLLGVIQVASTAEAMVQCEAAGIDLHAAAEAFALGYTGSKHVAHHAETMAEGKRGQKVAFSGKGRLKDSQYGVQFAKKLGRQALIGEAASDVFGQMVEVGMGDANDSEVIDALRQIAKSKANDTTSSRLTRVRIAQRFRCRRKLEALASVSLHVSRASKDSPGRRCPVPRYRNSARSACRARVPG